ncbi:MAG: hypothetical protein WC712_06005 [Candidatus Brocadiia bacterium]
MRTKRHRVCSSSIGMISVVLIVLAVFYGASSSAPAEQAELPAFVQVGPIRMVLIPATRQAIPLLKEGYADFEAEPVYVDVPVFYLAERPVFLSDFPDFFSQPGLLSPEEKNYTKYPIMLNPYETVLLLEYLNETLKAEQDGKPLTGAFIIPTVTQLYAAAFKGERYTPGTEIPDWIKWNVLGVADRFSGSTPILGRVPTVGDPPKAVPHRDRLFFFTAFNAFPCMGWPDFPHDREFKRYRSSSNVEPFGMNLPLNIHSRGNCALLSFVVPMEGGR